MTHRACAINRHGSLFGDVHRYTYWWSTEGDPDFLVCTHRVRVEPTTLRWPRLATDQTHTKPSQHSALSSKEQVLTRRCSGTSAELIHPASLREESASTCIYFLLPWGRLLLNLASDMQSWIVNGDILLQVLIQNRFGFHHRQCTIVASKKKLVLRFADPFVTRKLIRLASSQQIKLCKLA
jgi:hypothetical protein